MDWHYEYDEASNTVEVSGELYIDYTENTIVFRSGNRTILRITHLPTPIPDPGSFMIDLVAIRHVTSYTPHAVRERGTQDE